MKASDLLEKSHVLVTQAIDDLPETQWDVPGVCGPWSVKEVLAHLIMYERMTIDVIQAMSSPQAPASLQAQRKDQDDFNATEVAKWQYHTAQQVLNDYEDAQVQSTSLLAALPEGAGEQGGTIEWYRPGASLADFIQSIYDHTREHCTQIIHFREENPPA